MAVKLNISDPVIITQGPEYKDVGWGVYQEPSINISDDGTIYAGIKVTEDSWASYGSKDSRAYYYSKDGGTTWSDVPKSEWSNISLKCGFRLQSGERIKMESTPMIKAEPQKLPEASVVYDPITGRPRRLYLVENIPDDMMHKGWICDRYSPDTNAINKELAKVEWKNWAVFGTNNNELFTPFPHGRLRLAPDGNAWQTHYGRGLHPETGAASAFLNQYYFKSEDNAHSWKLVSCIPYIPDISEAENVYDREGFCEADIAFMPDGSIITLLRTGYSIDMKHPLYISRSTDNGKTWSKPRVFDKMGVWPCLCTLGCGVTLASYGRPGFFIRATDAPGGEYWDEPITLISTEVKPDAESIPTCGEDRCPIEWRSTCSYSDMVALDDITALLVYTDFYIPDRNGINRKTLLCRKITVEK